MGNLPGALRLESPLLRLVLHTGRDQSHVERRVRIWEAQHAVALRAEQAAQPRALSPLAAVAERERRVAGERHAMQLPRPHRARLVSRGAPGLQDGR